MSRTLFFRLHVGGYWEGDGSYNGGAIRECRVDFENPSLAMLIDMVLREGYAENMSKFSWCHSEVVQEHRKYLSCDNDVEEMICCFPSFEIIDLYVVRSDEPYLDDVLIGENEEEEEEPESDGEQFNFYRDDYVSDDSDDDGDKSDFYVGQSFVTKERCKDATEKYAIREKVNICFDRSERKKTCVQKDICGWRIYASINSRSESMVVRSYRGTHKCYVTGAVKLYSAPKIAADFLNEFRTNRDLSADQIMKRLLLNGLRVPKTKCQSARQIMMHIIDDEYAEQFTRIRIIHLDGRMKGQLLTAVGRDPNDSMYIIAWAIVPVENKVYWEWFMTLLKEDLSLELGNGLALSSDQQKGLAYAIKNSNRRLEEIKKVNLSAYEELKRSIGSNWSRAFFSDIIKSASVENNISESYNAVLKDARKKPIIALLEDIRKHVISSNTLKIKEMEKATGRITPKASAIIEKRKKSLRSCQTQRCGKGMYEVDHGRNKYRVCVRSTFSCACRSYDGSGIPCCHIIVAMLEEYGHTKLPETIVSDWYLLEKWKMCYNFLLLPVNGMDLWKRHSDVIVMPPPDKIMPGRPKNNDRIRDPSEVLSDHAKVKVTCSNCRQIGHNKRKCMFELVPKPPNLPPGRPSKK